MSTSFNSLTQQLMLLRDEIKQVNQRKAELEHERTKLETQVMSMLDEQESTMIRTQHGSISISESEIAQVEDWEDFENYIYENRALYLLQRRPSNPAYREMVKTDGAIPGVVSFTKRTINLRKTT